MAKPMTIAKLRRQLRKFTKELQDKNLAFARAVQQVHGEINERIFVSGKATNGRAIGSYSEKPGYFRKPGASSAVFFPGGYKEFKRSIGRNTFVDLRLTGQLESDHRTGLAQVSAQVWESRLSNTANQQKAEELEQHFNREIFGASRKEQDRITELIEKQLKF